MMRLLETRKQNTMGNQVNLIKMIGKGLSNSEK